VKLRALAQSTAGGNTVNYIRNKQTNKQTNIRRLTSMCIHSYLHTFKNITYTSLRALIFTSASLNRFLCKKPDAINFNLPGIWKQPWNKNGHSAHTVG